MREKANLKNILLAGALTALTGEIYFYPFGTGFRFTVGVITISFLMLYFYSIPELILIPFSGINVVFFRTFLSVYINGMVFGNAFRLHYPSFFYYLAYALLLNVGRVKQRLKEPINFITIMALADVLSNFVELLVRQELNVISFQERYTLALSVGFTRGIITFCMYWMFERYRILIVREEHQKRYSELLALLAELKAELFYIKKSTGNLEWAMKESYDIYQSLDQGLGGKDTGDLRKKALNLAKDIHEIKKDYLRIAAGVAELLPEESQDGMRLSDIINIIKSNTERWIKTRGFNIEFATHIDEDLMVKKYFSITSIINNIISNALDAFEGPGKIQTDFFLRQDAIVIAISDNGKGIDPKDLPYIFEPGFSTKFAEDGAIYTGLGLTHTKNLVEDMGGSISVRSCIGEGTTFEIMLPRQ